ncbi:MAG TPA: thermonuclease family protein, partial [Gallionella sp.]|nr:thermonuclease family protein [Gallionella sp.]
MMLLRSLLLMSLLFAGGAAQGAEFVAKVIAVLDGDTVLIKRTNGLKKIRLAGIDAPEKAQTFGETSRRSLADMVLGQQVKITSEAIDQYGRMVAHLNMGGLDVNAEQLRRGMAWEYSRFHNDRAMLALQEEAKREPRGLWALSDPMPPWEWRKLHPSTLSEPSSHGAASPPAIASPADTVCGAKKHCS